MPTRALRAKPKQAVAAAEREGEADVRSARAGDSCEHVAHFLALGVEVSRLPVELCSGERFAIDLGRIEDGETGLW